MPKNKFVIAGAVLVAAFAVYFGVSHAALADDSGGDNTSGLSAVSNLLPVVTTTSSEGESSNQPSNIYSYASSWQGQAKELENAFSSAFDSTVQSGIKADQMPSSLSIGPNGQIRITGANLTAVSGSALTVNVWGMTFNVNAAQSQLAGSSQQTIALTDMQVGDKLTVTGTIDPSTGAVTGQVIVDYSLATRQAGSALQSRISQLLQLIQQLQSQLNLMQGGTSAATSAATSTAGQ
ncbi:MAG: hypothetical protein KGL39_02560 [Patescibacteria group bacterium]|nr:hypothetical protein [Patescibacteria group bacterium]